MDFIGGIPLLPVWFPYASLVPPGPGVFLPGLDRSLARDFSFVV